MNILNNLKLLRFPYSLFLLPVYLFSYSQLPVQAQWQTVWLSFLVLHLLVYPASNGYNSYMDQDDTSIGCLKNPPKATKSLFYIASLMDFLAVCLSYLVSVYFALGVAIYILVSRAYSSRNIRIKKYPYLGFLTVTFFQGFWIYAVVYFGLQPYWVWDIMDFESVRLPGAICSALIAGSYPLTQVYQHEADAKDGVQTISMVLGIKGTFVFSALLFMVATLLFYIYLPLDLFLVLPLFLSPVLIFFGYWMYLSFRDAAQANFKYSLYMNVLASLCMNAFYLYIMMR